MPDDSPIESPSVDISSLDAVQPQLQRLQRMETINALAGGVAHEFNNLLLAIRGNLALALMAPDISESMGARLNQAEMAAARASELSQQLMALARPMANKEEAVDFNQVAQEAAALAASTFRGRITIAVQPTSEPPRVWMDFSAAVQMILSLCFNAGEAFPLRPTGARVTICNELIRLNEAELRMAGRCDGDMFVCCAVADNGPGIASEALPYLFTPFYTTKAHGTGIGLAVVQAVARAAGGLIEARNRPEGGAEIRVLLPLHTAREKTVEVSEKTLDAVEKIF